MRKWLQALVDQYIPAVEQLQNTPQDQAEALKWASWMRQKWAEYGMTALKQQRNLMTDVRGAIKTRLGTDHVALESMNFTMEEWIAINSPIDEQVARRNENVVLLDNPDAIVSQAVRLLESREWADVAAGLVVVTGRRSTEILGTANFQPKSQWSVIFSGALKRRGETQVLSIEIPTLTTAERVIGALTKLRRMCSTEGLRAEEINQKYSQAVAAACDRHFSSLVPNRNGRDNLFTHLFRSVYAAIATYWYAPPTLDANEYKAAIQGHYAILDTADGTRRRSLAAARHYNDYKIGDRLGNIDGRQGIKLGHGGVELIDTFKPRTLRTGVTLAIPGEQRVLEIEDQKITDLEDTTMTSTHNGDQQLFESISEALEALPVVARENQEIEDSHQPAKQQMPRRMKSVSVDLNLLKAAAGQLGIEIRRGKGKATT
jgi:Telomere resolvase